MTIDITLPPRELLHAPKRDTPHQLAVGRTKTKYRASPMSSSRCLCRPARFNPQALRCPSVPVGSQQSNGDVGMRHSLLATARDTDLGVRRNRSCSDHKHVPGAICRSRQTAAGGILTGEPPIHAIIHKMSLAYQRHPHPATAMISARIEIANSRGSRREGISPMGACKRSNRSRSIPTACSNDNLCAATRRLPSAPT